MSYQLNNKLAKLVPYDPIVGEYSIRLDANESCFDLGDELKKKVADKISEISFNRYPDSTACSAVKAFADFYGIDEDMVTAGNGSDELISVITSCFLESGDTVVTLSNDFSMYAFYSKLYELNVKIFNNNDDCTIDTDKLMDFCKANNAKALVFSNPCNPTSLGLEKNDVRKILDSLDCLVVLDEAYMDFWAESMLPEIKKYDNCIILKTCSKAIGMAAIRMGYAVAGKTVTTALRAAKSPYNTDTIAQTIAEVVLSEKDLLIKRRNTIIANTKNLYNEMIRLKDDYNLFDEVYDTKTNFVFIKTKYFNEIYVALLERSVAIRKFNGFLRISTGTEQENKELLIKLREILDNLKG